MPRVSERKLFLQVYEQESIEFLQLLEAELELELDELEINLEMELEGLNDESTDSDSSLSSSSSSSMSSSSSSQLSSNSFTSSSSNSMNQSSDDELYDTSESEEFVGILDELLPIVQNQRYLRERIYKPKSQDFVLNILPQLDDDDFKEQYRMFPTSFSHILARTLGSSNFSYRY